MTSSSELSVQDQRAIEFGKKPLQIFILIDLMMLMVFMLLSRPENDLPAQIMLDARNGYVQGTKISLHNDFGERVGALMSYGGALVPLDEKELTSYLNGVGCRSGSCMEVLPKDIYFTEARIYFPDEIMMLAYSMLSNFCSELQCDRTIYIRAEIGEVLLCSRKHQRFFTYNQQEGSLLEDERCKPARSN